MTVSQPHALWIWLARIRRPQGRKGEVFADILTDFPEKFAERRHLWLLDSTLAETRQGGTSQAAEKLESWSPVKGHDFSCADQTPDNKRPGFNPCAEPREVTLLHHWLHKGGIVLHFTGIDSITAAETLAGLIVAIPASERTQLPAGEFHIADLIGCSLIDVAPTPPVEIGIIENVDRSAGPVPLLIARGAAGEILIPFAEIYLRKIDLEISRVEMSLPQGLTDLNQR